MERNVLDSIRSSKLAKVWDFRLSCDQICNVGAFFCRLANLREHCKDDWRHYQNVDKRLDADVTLGQEHWVIVEASSCVIIVKEDAHDGPAIQDQAQDYD